MEEYYAIVRTTDDPLRIIGYYFSHTGPDLTKPGPAYDQTQLVHLIVPVPLRSSPFLNVIYNSGKYEIIIDQVAIQQSIVDQWAFLREQRNKRLAETDWIISATDIRMSPEKKNEWIIYRQALRDLPSQIGDPSSVIWPTKPDSSI